MRIRIFDVDHGFCAIVYSPTGERIALVDCGHNKETGWRPSSYICNTLKRGQVDYLIVTNADQDHVSDLPNVYALGVTTLYRNSAVPAAELRSIKEKDGPVSSAMETYLAMHTDFTVPPSVPFDSGMGGINLVPFRHRCPTFTDTNNLSLVAFIEYNGFVIAFPGDLEKPGWREHLKSERFRQMLQKTTVLVASHHGRENGFCDEVFRYKGKPLCQPLTVVVSDKSKEYDTQEVPQYQYYVSGVIVEGETRTRHVLTTRRDGAITFDVDSGTRFSVYTSGQ